MQYRDPSNFVPLNKLYLGPKVAAAVTNSTLGLTNQNLEAFQKRCLSFLIESVNQICMRFPFKDKTLENLRFINPKEVKSRKIASIGPLSSAFPGFVGPDKIIDLDREWRVLRNSDVLDSEINDAESFWETVREIKSGDETPMFPNLSKFVFGVLCLPHSSATAERIFSTVNNLKTKQRNRLSTKTLIGLLHSKRYLKGECFNFAVDDKLVKMMTSDMYNYKGIENDD